MPEIIILILIIYFDFIILRLEKIITTDKTILLQRLSDL